MESPGKTTGSFSLAHGINRLVIAAGLGGITLLSWIYLLNLTVDMQGNAAMMTDSITIPTPQVWDKGEFQLTFLMWSVMMVAMMTPSASPMILAYAGLNIRRAPGRQVVFTSLLFFLGYLGIWTGFSLAVTFAQWGLNAAAWVSAGGIKAVQLLAGFILILAGSYQFTPLKSMCLVSCRSPLSFLLASWRPGLGGALVMGLRHGFYCLGCCWLLMTLLFVAGVMNWLWVAFIAGIVLLEKAAPGGVWISRLMGLLSIGWGIWLLVGMLGK